ncbi:MAG: RadC family protein [Candidatus Binatia bacterium]
MRTRLLAAGGRACSDVELLAIVLGHGVATAQDLALARALLAHAGGIERLDRLDHDAPPLVGRAAARRVALIRAALELGRRASASPLPLGEPIRDAAAVHAHVRGCLPQLDREVFLVLLLDGRNRFQGAVRVSEGTLTSALVHPREVFAPAIRAGAAAVILVHNHPSGDPTPSSEDAALTERLRQVGEVVGIRVLDHVVIGQGRYVSLAEERRW